ncbi:MAG: OB-fold nucleic acid binding domain-containing protein [Candidatus Aenigmatarchaeota archaeon]
METKRQPAIVSRISDLTKSRFVKKDGFEPSYVVTDMGIKISKAKIMGTVTNKYASEDGNYAAITIDDETDAIRVKVFKEDVDMLSEINEGDIVIVVGKPREYADEIYIIPNFVRKVADPNAFLLHKLEILKELKHRKRIFDIVNSQKSNFADLEELKVFLQKEYALDEDETSGIIEYFALFENSTKKDYKSLIIEKIKELDKGKGVELAKLTQELDIPIEILSESINELLEDGLCFEPLPGTIKLV